MSQRLALLLTDVVDSTQLAERLGDAAAAELNAAHDRMARDLLRSWRGREIDKTDGMLMLFDSAADALGYAVAYHAALAALPVPLRARAGLHVELGDAAPQPPEDVARGAKPVKSKASPSPWRRGSCRWRWVGRRCSPPRRRMPWDRPGCVCSRTASGASRAWPSRWNCSRPVGRWHRSRRRPIRPKSYRVVRREGLWLPLCAVANNLPAGVTASWAGRTYSSTWLGASEAGTRLVSVLGIGGTGKTRLALRFAHLAG